MRSSGNVTTYATAAPATGCSAGTTNTTYYSHTATYDSVGRTLTDNGANGQSFKYSYDVNGNVATKTDSTNKIWAYSYNAFNQLQSMTDPLNQITRFAYDGAGHLSTVTDPKNNVTDYYYDGFGNLTAQTSPDTGVTSFTYDTLGRRMQMTRADGTVTTYVYDPLNRIKQIQAGSLINTYAYDYCTYGIGRLCAIIDESGQTLYGYRQNGQLQDQLFGNGAANYSTHWDYDNRDEVTGMRYPSGNYISYSYDDLSHVTSINATIAGVSHPVASTLNYLGLGLGPLSDLTTGDFIDNLRTYDSDLRLIGLSAGSVQSLSYGYDTDNRITSITDNLTPANSETLTYDADSRLLNTVSSGLGNESISYDANGNRLHSAQLGNYTVDPASNRVTALTNYINGYDANGNLSSFIYNGSLLATYSYDAFNHFSSFNQLGSITNYQYNGLRQRTAKSGAAGAYNYIYAPDGTLLSETALNSTAIGSEYIWLRNQPVGLIRSGTLYYFHNDHLGRPASVTNASGSIVWQQNNLPFKTIVTADSIGPVNLGFPGQYYDVESGLYYNDARYFNPIMGQYMESDPIGLAGGLNTYAYVGGNPISRVDQSGLFGTPLEVGAGAIAGAIGGYYADGNRGAFIGFFSGGLVGFVNPFESEAAGATAAALFRDRFLTGVLENVSGQALTQVAYNGKSPLQALSNINLPLAAASALGGQLGIMGAESLGGISSITSEALGGLISGASEQDYDNYVEPPEDPDPVSVVPVQNPDPSSPNYDPNYDPSNDPNNINNGNDNEGYPDC